MTSELIALGDADADNRWIGIRRHQAVLVVAGIGLGGDWLITSHKTPFEVLASVLLLVAAFPTVDGLTLGQLIAHVGLFLTRSHWSETSYLALGSDVELFAKGSVSFRTYELVHRGRLDLSGRDESLADGLVALIDGFGASNSSTHLSQHVLRGEHDIITVLAAPIEAPMPDGWRERSDAEVLKRLCGEPSMQHLETLTSIRFRGTTRRVYRVRDFSSIGSGKGFLEQFLRTATDCDVTLHAHVLSGAKGQRLAARAVHRMGSDEETSRSAGFRRTARSARGLERLRQREAHVANGRALLQIGVFVVVKAPSNEELRTRSKEVWRTAQRVGLRLERGWGSQALWFRGQLPGGASW